MTRVFESNGPDIKIRGTASHVAEKYVQLARDARSSGDPVAAENYYQHAEHYFRLIAAAQEQFRQNQPQPRTENEMPSEDGDDESESFSNFGQEPGFVPAQQQPFVPRDNNQRDITSATISARASPTSRASSISRASTTHREHRPQPQFQPQPQPQPQPVIADSVSVDRLPSFITGPQPQINGGGRRLRRQWRRALPAAPPPPAARPAPRRHARAGDAGRRFQSGQ